MQNQDNKGKSVRLLLTNSHGLEEEGCVSLCVCLSCGIRTLRWSIGKFDEHGAREAEQCLGRQHWTEWWCRWRAALWGVEMHCGPRLFGPVGKLSLRLFNNRTLEFTGYGLLFSVPWIFTSEGWISHLTQTKNYRKIVASRLPGTTRWWRLSRLFYWFLLLGDQVHWVMYRMGILSPRGALRSYMDGGHTCGLRDTGQCLYTTHSNSWWEYNFILFSESTDIF